jgi:hypothetical protein
MFHPFLHHSRTSISRSLHISVSSVLLSLPYYRVPLFSSYVTSYYLPPWPCMITFRSLWVTTAGTFMIRDSSPVSLLVAVGGKSDAGIIVPLWKSHSNCGRIWDFRFSRRRATPWWWRQKAPLKRRSVSSGCERGKAKWATAQGLACLTPVLLWMEIDFSPKIVAVVCLIHVYFYLRQTTMKKELRISSPWWWRQQGPLKRW